MISQERLTLRELNKSDLEQFASYWFDSDEMYLTGMGVDVTKLPSKEDFFKYWNLQIQTPVEKRLSYCIVWEKDKTVIGHSSTRPTEFGKEAYMHIHLWNAKNRQKGLGLQLIKLTIAHYFETLQLKDLYCEPYSFNKAPNKVLEKAGFDFVKEYSCTPGPFNFEQPVKLWHLSLDKFNQLSKTGL